MSKPAARIGDMHVCPMLIPGKRRKPHVGGPIIGPGVSTVKIGGMTASVMGDMCVCQAPAPPDSIVMGSTGVLIGSKPAARMGDMTAHGGSIVAGCPTVLIGEISPGAVMTKTSLTILEQFVPQASGVAQQILAMQQAAHAGQPFCELCVDAENGSPKEDSFSKDGLPKKKPAKAKIKIPKECSYLDTPPTVESPKKDFDKIRKKAVVGKPKAGKHTFPGDKKASDANVYEVTVNGRKIKVTAPKTIPKGKNIPTSEQIAKGLGVVPSKQLDAITQVVISPNANPDDAYWAKEYGIKDFSSAATGGGGGATFYPTKNKWLQEVVDSTMIHESGHTYSQKIWRNGNVKEEWKKAIASDGKPPSDYAKSSIGEDFSESLVMYSLSKGTPCEKTAKQLYPERYKSLDKLMK